MKKLLDKYFRKPNAKRIMFIYSRKELIAMGRSASFYGALTTARLKENTNWEVCGTKQDEFTRFTKQPICDISFG